MELRTQNIEFSNNVKFDGNKSTEVDTDFEIYNNECIVNQNGEQEFNIGIKLIVNKYTSANISLINNIKVEEMNQNKRQCSLAIYIVKEGDTLWKIAKKFKSTVDQIAEVNEIDNLDKLNIGEQLFIPRYVCRSAC